MKIALITCYKDPNYVRGQVIKRCLSDISGVEVLEVKNRQTNPFRFIEVIYKLIKVRKLNPDIYFLTFRGQEILPFVLFLAKHKPVIFDEFIVPMAWSTEEKHDISLKNIIFGLITRIVNPMYKKWLNRCQIILSDTKPDAEISSKLSGVSISKYKTLPVSADESVFKKQEPKSKESFSVFYYGNMLPLHGLPYVLEAAKLTSQEDVHFIIAGGGRLVQGQINKAISSGARITYYSWIKYDKLIDYIADSDLCLGGPYGGTPQADRVITGKTYQFLASQRPVLIGESKANQYFIDKRNSIIAKQASVKDLVEKILWAKNNPQELTRISENGYKLYQEHYSNSVITKSLESIIQSVKI